MHPRPSIRRHPSTSLLGGLLLCALLGIGAESSCGPDLLEDPTFDLWCGDELCGWELEAGMVEPVPTWHVAEDGASLVGDPVVISQLVEKGSDEVDCIRFTLVADVDADASLSLEMDFLDDGTAEYDHPLVSDDYQAAQYMITPPTQFQGIRFRIRKLGMGRAVLAQIRAEEDDAENCNEPPLQITDLPIGSLCEADAECASLVCADIPMVDGAGPAMEYPTCGACDADPDCTKGDVCGLAWGEGWYGHRECATAGTKSLGETCAVAGECVSGFCDGHQCAECEDDGDCTGGARCHPAVNPEIDPDLMPSMCDPNSESRVSGAACLSDDDCASGVCEHDDLLSICVPDGRPCQTSADCPWTELGGECIGLGARDGTCL